MTVRITIMLLILLRGCYCSAQTPSMDSIAVWLTQSETFSKNENNGSDALVFAQKALKTAQNIGDKALISWSLRHIGMAYRVAGEFDKAATAYESSLEYQSGRTEITIRLTAEYARVLHHQRRTVEASQLYLKALDMYTTQLTVLEASRNLDIKALVLERMAVLLTNQKQYAEAERYALEAYEICEKLKDYVRLQITATALGNIYYWTKNTKKSAFYYQSAFDFSKLIGRPSGRPLNNLAIIYNLEKQHDKAIETYYKAIEVYKKLNEHELIAQVYINIGGALNEAGRYQEAIESVERGIQQLRDLHSTAGIPEGYEELMSIYVRKNDFKKALEYQIKMTVLNDSIAAKSRQKDLTELQARFETAKKEGEIKGLKSEKVLRDLSFQRQQFELTNQRLISERNAVALKAAQREQDIQDLEFQKTASELKEIEQIKNLQAAQLVLNQKDKEIKEQKIAEQTQNLNLLRGVLFLGGLLGLSLWQLLRYRQREERVRKKMETERLQNKTHRSLLEMKAEALRAQMNPHFIFNSLNTIEGFMLQNKTLEASSFLQKFSKLIRLVLENSRHATISLEQDLEVLRIYAQLESIRYEGTFQYEFDVDDDILDHSIPPTLIQPFIENAILHGLRHRFKSTEGGFLKITAEEVDKNLVIRIEDNGIGRDNARKNQAQSTLSSKTSIGMDNTAERLRIFSAEAQLVVRDLNPTAPDGNVGTFVEIHLPNST
ncbi:MAG: tetratricopeptide repeat protein [Saprospiraceae bacterium]|nr:tetratricopeptide repeat protein [Saprospiraceae bacterium]